MRHRLQRGVDKKVGNQAVPTGVGTATAGKADASAGVMLSSMPASLRR
jgi:hypothetical protein